MASFTSAYAAKLTGKRILVTGGTGYIGSHTVVELVQAGAHVVIIDNLCNSHLESLNRIKTITGVLVEFHKIDLRDYDALDALLASTTAFDACIHFAGLKAVGESVTIPLKYYEYNVTGAINLFRALEKHKCKNLVFSSSATVYGMGAQSPIVEDSPLSTTNPYGQTKLVIEGLLQDIARAPVPAGEKPWNIALLRYFNPIGAHKSGLIGEDPRGIPNNLLPYVMQVAVGRLQHVNVFGTDYPTPDGTCVRDYIHVVDLAQGHLAALREAIFRQPVYPAGFSALRDPMNDGPAPNGCYKNGSYVDAFNLGTGKGVSVLELLSAYSQAAGKKLPYVMAARRAGDAAQVYAQPAKVNTVLKWDAKYTVLDACRDSFNWKSKNPKGYQLNHDAAAKGLQMKIKAKL